MDLGSTVRNLTRSFTSHERSPSPETPRVARNLDRATNVAEETIAYMDDIMSAYSVANVNDDRDYKDDNPPAYYRRQVRGIQQAPKKSKVRQLVRQFEEYQGTPSTNDGWADDGMDEYDLPPAEPRLDRQPMRLQMRQPEQRLRPTEVRTSVSRRNSKKPTFPQRSTGMTGIDHTLLIEEFVNECEIELDMERDGEKLVEQRNRRIADDKKRFEESQLPGNSTSVRKMYPRGSATRQAASNTTATTFRPLGGGKSEK